MLLKYKNREIWNLYVIFDISISYGPHWKNIESQDNYLGMNKYK